MKSDRVCRRFLTKCAVKPSGFHRRFESVKSARLDGEHTALDLQKSRAVRVDARRIKHSVGGGNADSRSG